MRHGAGFNNVSKARFSGMVLVCGLVLIMYPRHGAGLCAIIAARPHKSLIFVFKSTFEKAVIVAVHGSHTLCDVSCVEVYVARA